MGGGGGGVGLNSYFITSNQDCSWAVSIFICLSIVLRLLYVLGYFFGNLETSLKVSPIFHWSPFLPCH